ncbi:4Fe-4S dicluster domain-containing protein [bacterium]|nr:4Fe-4S dicluster domain-containing protein [bacterium]MBU1651309.1 4Fe-4S dicluster domain-containing protein [bacterium]MBU1881060.1 4Fe-4S dicluster domain-containing protein [bacterium]
MSFDRRKFVKAASIAALGGVVSPPLKLFGGVVVDGQSAEAVPEAVSGCIGCECSPVAPPTNATRWAMVIDLKTCREHEDCTICMDACHKTHNVPDVDNPKEQMKWIWKEHFGHAFHEADHPYLEEHVKHSNALLMCNHCNNPPCVSVCPTNATFKREKDGLVMMDWHRCIGCRYCIAACPYGSRSFNYTEPKKYFAEKGIQIEPDFPTRTRGVVEKCTFCEERLARGLWPACVDACPHNALVFGDLDNPDDPVRCLLAKHFTIRRKPALGTEPEIYYIV